MTKYTGKIYTNTFNILPNRLPYFEERMKQVKKAADAQVPKIPFDYVIKPGISVPLGPHLISQAKAHTLADSRINSNGDWVRDVLPVEIIHGELGSEDFDRIGYIKFVDLTLEGGGKTFLPYIVKKEGTWTQEEHDKRVIEIMPQLESLARNFNSKTDLNCHHCQPAVKGDKKKRDVVQIIRAKQDTERTGGMTENTSFPMIIKKGEILQIGSWCFKKYTGIDVKTLASFYEIDQPVAARGPNGSPQGRTGYGYKTMGVWDYAERMVRYYSQREKEWLSAQRKSLWEVDSPDQIYGKGTLAPLIDGVRNYKGGCFIEGAGTRLLQGRMFNMETDDDEPARWYLQPWTGTGSVEEMKKDWKAGLDEARIYISVPQVNELTGEEIIDPATGHVSMIDEAMPNPEYLDRMVHARKRKGSYLGKGWRTAVVKVFPPATESKYVQKTVNRMMDWILNHKPSGKHGVLQLRIKGTIELQYVGSETKKDMNELWRMFMYVDFDRRKRADKKQQINQFQKIGSDLLSAAHPDAEWYSFDKEDRRHIIDYIEPFFGKRYTSYHSSSNFNRAFSERYGIVYMTPTQWADFPAWRDAKEKKELADKKEREAANAYRHEVSRIRRQQFGHFPRPYNQRILYDAPVGAFLDFMGWSSLNVPARFNHATSLFHIDADGVSVALLTDKQYDEVNSHFGPLMGQPVITNVTPAPQSSTPASVPQTATATAGRITLAEAKRKRDGASATSSYQGAVGSLIPLVKGWLVFKSAWEGGMRPGKHDTTWNTKGRMLGLLDNNGNYYVITHPSANSSQPRVGDYYNLFDVEVTAHDTYKGLQQTFITDPVDWMDLEFVNATV